MRGKHERVKLHPRHVPRPVLPSAHNAWHFAAKPDKEAAHQACFTCFSTKGEKRNASPKQGIA